MPRLTYPLLCECLLFLVPLNVYVIGDHLANGVQWALFRYQESSMGNSLILLHKDILYVTNGILRGASATETIIWVAGSLLLIAALALLIVAVARNMPSLVRPAGILTAFTGALFFIAMTVEYGPNLANAHGLSVPIGVPLVFVTGIWLAFGEFGTTEEKPADETTGLAE